MYLEHGKECKAETKDGIQNQFTPQPIYNMFNEIPGKCDYETQAH
jgi:hypothetical protein